MFATEHFNEVVQAWTCAAAPVSDPETGHVIGVIDLTGEMAAVHPHSMAVATATAHAIEAQLRCQMVERDGRLLARYGDHLRAGPGPRALVTRSGRVIASEPLGWLPTDRLTVPPRGGELPIGDTRALVAEVLGCEEAYVIRSQAEPTPRAGGGRSRTALSVALLGRDRADAELPGGRQQLRLRHSEILTLLCAKPEGLTSEELSEGVYGTPTRASAIRVEISRLRKLLGDCIETEHYRLRGRVSSDVAQVCGLLHRGEVREAAARYAGPLLPGSIAPGVIREREALIREHLASPMILVFADGRIDGNTQSDSEWADTPSGRFESYVVNVVHDVDGRFATRPCRQDRAIAGLSAGAYGAANIGLHQVAVFSLIQAWSGYFIETHNGVFAHATRSQMAYNSPLDYVWTMKRKLREYPLRAFLYVGHGDSDRDQIFPMAAALKDVGADVQYAIYPGGHSWGLWSPRTDQMLMMASHDFAARCRSRRSSSSPTVSSPLRSSRGLGHDRPRT